MQTDYRRTCTIACRLRKGTQLQEGGEKTAEEMEGKREVKAIVVYVHYP